MRKWFLVAVLTVLGSMSCPHYGMVPKSMAANLTFRKNVLSICRSDPFKAAAVKQMCADDLMFYINTFCWTYDPRHKTPVLPFITYDFQDEAMLSMADCIQSGEDFVVPKSRTMGASWMGLTVFEWFWHFKKDLSFLLISRNEKYVDESGNPKTLFWKIDFLHKYQPKWLLPTGRWMADKDPARRLLHLANADNDSVIDGESTTGDAGRGDRRTAMFIDEHAAFDINDGFKVLRATRDTTKCRGFNSTPQGANNAFYEICHNSSARNIRLHWTSHPEYNKGLYRADKDGKLELLDGYSTVVTVRKKGEEAREVKFPEDYPFRLDGKTRSPWYDNECSRCVSEMEIAQELDIDFLGSDYQFFDSETIDILRKKNARPPILIGDLEFDPETQIPKRFTENIHGDISLWLPLNSSGKIPHDMKFAIGSDVSAGTGASNSVSSIVNIATGEKIGVLRTPHVRPNGFANYTMALAKFFNNAFMIWDASGPTGKTFTMRVMATGYGNIYYRKMEKKVGQRVTDEPGYFLNPEARTHVFENYRDALGSQTFINRSAPAYIECLQFIVKPGGLVEHSKAANSQDPSGAKSAHGDEVVADALASLALSEKERIKESSAPEIPEGCLAWRIAQKKAAEVVYSGELGEGWS